MKLVAYCIGLSETEIESIKRIKNDAGITVKTANGMTTIKAIGIYDDLLEVLVTVTQFKTFEVHLN